LATDCRGNGLEARTIGFGPTTDVPWFQEVSAIVQIK
jgi:hypothetical protein